VRGSAVVLDESEITELRAGCTRFVHWHGRQDAASMLATVPPDTELDRYGAGGVVAELEGTVAELLGKPAAAFVPSGTMGQQCVLRVHADRRASRTLLFHPACHVDVQEGRGYERLHGLIGRPVGEPDRLIALADLKAVAEPAGVLLLELPQRDLGGRQPAWDDLVEQCRWAADRGMARHLDGARLWESAVGYDRSPSEVADLFDTVYVSFYKGLGALPGCCVAGPDDVIAEVREWRRRMGGTLFGLWPNAASALSRLRARLPKMPEYLSHARRIADALSDLPGVQVVPDPPQVSMFHLVFDVPAEQFETTARRLATDHKVWTWGGSTTDLTGRQHVELAVGDATLEFSPEEFRDVIAAFTDER
jgi:threonine aldolase